MQEMVRFLAERHVEEFGINLLDFRVIVRFAELLAAILFVNGADARPAFFIRGEARLPAAADAASGQVITSTKWYAVKPDRTASTTDRALARPCATARLTVTPSRNDHSGAAPEMVSDNS